jgi:hypothetical protein
MTLFLRHVTMCCVSYRPRPCVEIAPANAHAEVRVLSEVECLMIVFGGECLNVWSEVREFRLQPKQRGHPYHRPGRDIDRRCGAAGRILILWSGGLRRSPFELCAVGPDAVQDDGNLPGHRDFGLFGPNPLHQPGAPGLQG